MKNMNYFLDLANYAKELLDSLPIERTPQPLDYAVGKLYGIIADQKDEEVAKLKKIKNDYAHKKQNLDVPIGLNTIGMLTDRFTILLIKEWSLRNKSNDEAKAIDLFNSQTKEIIEALSSAIPGNSSINSKITNIKTDIQAKDWEEAFFGLLTINLVLWESQEILYIKDISLLPSEELRAYIHWFAHGNMKRNVLIELSELRYWEQFNLN